jgi:CBS-domain-containing membrane protein
VIFTLRREDYERKLAADQNVGCLKSAARSDEPTFGPRRRLHPSRGVTSAAQHVVSAPMCDRTKFIAILAGATGGAVAVAGMETFSARTAFPLAAIPFATSIVTVLGSPKAEPAQPRALIGGHLVSTFVGLLVVKFFGPAPWAAALAVGLAMVAMHLTGTFHPPAGIDPLVVVVNDMSWDFLLAPVGIGAILLALFAVPGTV